MDTHADSEAQTETSPPAPFSVGERVEGTLAELENPSSKGRIQLADGRTVSIEATELAGDGQGEPAVEVGGSLTASVVRIDPNGEVWVSRSRGSGALLLLLNARDHGDTVQGRVVAQGPAGLEVDLGGGVFALCPPSEVGSDVDNPGHLVGEVVAFKVKDATPALVTLSRQAALADASENAADKRDKPVDESQIEEAAEVRRRLRPGAVMAGRISRLREFGAFVDLGGGVEGLIHLSELSHDRVGAPKDVVQTGQPVEVQVLKVDYDAHKGERISLSLKALAKSTWDKALGEIKEGEKRTGKVLRLEPFGAFVELLPGVTGLIHVSALGTKRHTPPAEVLKAGDEIEVEVLGLDKDKHRIALKRVPTEAEVVERRAAQQALREKKKAEARAKREELHKKPHERLKAGDIVDGTVDRIEPYGFFLQLKGGGRGMVHVSEMGPAPEGVDPTKPVAEQFPKGAKVKVAVLEIDAEHRIRLSRLAVGEIEKGASAETYLKHKAQHELEEKLLRSAARPPREARPRSGPSAQRGPRPPRKEGQAGAPEEGAQAQGQRRERPPPKRREAPPPRPGKSQGLGTLGDLLKVKLQQRSK